MKCSFLGVIAAAVIIPLFGSPATVTAQRRELTPPIPFEDLGACPFEGCVYRDWTARQVVTVHETRRPGAPVVYRLQPGDVATALTGVVITVKPGRAQVRTPTRIVTSDGEIAIGPGRTLFLLTPLGEGYMKVWFNGRYYRDADITSFYDPACETQPDRCNGRVIEPTQTEWWIQLRNRDGRVGWTNEPERLDGKDSLS